MPRLLDQEKEYPIVDAKPAPGQQQLTPKAAAETVNTGLAEILPETEGRARLEAVATLVATEAWAGQLAGPTELSVSRSPV